MKNFLCKVYYFISTEIKNTPSYEVFWQTQDKQAEQEVGEFQFFPGVYEQRKLKLRVKDVSKIKKKQKLPRWDASLWISKLHEITRFFMLQLHSRTWLF